MYDEFKERKPYMLEWGREEKFDGWNNNENRQKKKNITWLLVMKYMMNLKKETHIINEKRKKKFGGWKSNEKRKKRENYTSHKKTNRKNVWWFWRKLNIYSKGVRSFCVWRKWRKWKQKYRWLKRHKLEWKKKKFSGWKIKLKIKKIC